MCELCDAKERIRDLEYDLDGKDAEINRLERKVDDLKDELSEAVMELDDANNTIRELERQVGGD
jgi:predicted  nucleic acid-binding Zn-ribbon protein